MKCIICGATTTSATHRLSCLDALQERYLRERDLWREYATLLLNGQHTGLAIAHGWPGDPEGYKRGLELREALRIEAGTHADITLGDNT